MPAPVVIFVYNRPIHTRKMIEALSKNDLAFDTDVFIFSDASKDNSHQKDVEKTRNYIDSIAKEKLFKNVNIIKTSKNKGLAKSVINGVSTIIEKYGEVIVVEDDLVTEPEFLSFMNDSLKFYKKNKKIWSISGYSLPIKIPRNYKKDVYLSPRGSSWGWATWDNRWEKVDWEVSDYYSFKKDNKKKSQFNKGGRDLSDMLALQMTGQIDSWAIRWCYTQFKLDMYTIYPVKSFVRNIGLDGSGTHSNITNKFDMVLNDTDRSYKLENVNLNKVILKKFQNYYINPYRYYLSKLKQFIKKKISNN